MNHKEFNRIDKLAKYLNDTLPTNVIEAYNVIGTVKKVRSKKSDNGKETFTNTKGEVMFTVTPKRKRVLIQKNAFNEVSELLNSSWRDTNAIVKQMILQNSKVDLSKNTLYDANNVIN